MDPLVRFRADLRRLLPEGPPPGTPLALAVSGGPDSMAMLWLAIHALPGRTVAATVDHGFRPEAAMEAELVAAACRAHGVPHATLRPDEPIVGGNRQAKARRARYDVLGRWATTMGATVLATAHQLEDQAETFLMRAVRGSGPAGLAGVREWRRDGALTILRPVLGWHRSELAAVAAQAGLGVAADPSNVNERFERVRVRGLLAETSWLDPAGLAKAARHVAEAEAALVETADWLWSARATIADGHVEVDVGDLPREMRRRLSRRALAVRAPAGEFPSNIEPLLDALSAGRSATQGGVLVKPDGRCWLFSDAPSRRHR